MNSSNKVRDDLNSLCLNCALPSDFFRAHPWTNDQPQSVKYVLYFANIQNGVGTDMLNSLLNSETISDTCQQFCYTREEDSSEKG